MPQNGRQSHSPVANPTPRSPIQQPGRQYHTPFASPKAPSPTPQPGRQSSSPVANPTARSTIEHPGRQSHSPVDNLTPVTNPTAQSPIPLSYPIATPRAINCVSHIIPCPPRRVMTWTLSASPVTRTTKKSTNDANSSFMTSML
jgi:hypothetical protein